MLSIVQKSQFKIAQTEFFCYDDDTFMTKTYEFRIDYIKCPAGQEVADYIDNFIENQQYYPTGVLKIFIIPDDGEPVAGQVNFDPNIISENQVKQYLVNLGINAI